MLIQRRDAAYWPALHGLFSLFSDTTQDHQHIGCITLVSGMNPSTSVTDYSIFTINQDNTPLSCLETNLMVVFTQL